MWRNFCAGLCLSILLPACYTPGLWGSRSETDNYRERISSALISADGRTLVIVGTGYHYVFDAPPAIVRTLTSDFQKFVSASFGTFSVDLQERITGSYTLHLPHNTPEPARQAARNAGFSEEPGGGLMWFEGVLSGTRYSAGDVKVGASARALNREYCVNVTAQRSRGADIARKVLLTPVAVLGDGALVITATAAAASAIPLWVVSLPFSLGPALLIGDSPKC